tara:strand:- start:3331 stop:3543 length:213 start_codon:yes stop_codon:yes gene_type:complete
MFKVSGDYEITTSEGKTLDLWGQTQKINARGMTLWATMIDGEIHAENSVFTSIILIFADTIEFVEYLNEK